MRLFSKAAKFFRLANKRMKDPDITVSTHRDKGQWRCDCTFPARLAYLGRNDIVTISAYSRWSFLAEIKGIYAAQTEFRRLSATCPCHTRVVNSPGGEK